MGEYAASEGISNDRLLYEDQSLDTIGNGYWSRLEIDRIGGISELYLVTACFHMERATFVFRRCFGPTCSIVTEECYDSDYQFDPAAEQRRFDRTRELLDTVQPGDVRTLAHRIEDDYDLYERVPVPERYDAR